MHDKSEILRRQGWCYLSAKKLASLGKLVLKKWTNSFEEQNIFDIVLGSGLEGYFPARSEKAVGADAPDSKEFFHIYNPGNVSSRYSENLYGVFHECRRHRDKLLAEVSDLISADASLSFENPCDDLLRIVRYKPYKSLKYAEPHTDVTLFSFIIAEIGAGLEILSDKNQYQPASPNGEDIVALSGDMLSLITSKKIEPAIHRVVNHGTYRYALIYFGNPHNSSRLSEKWIAGDFVQSRLREMEFKR